MQGKALKALVTIAVTVTGLILAAPALAQESVTEFTSLDPIENIITNFESGVPTDGLSVEAAGADAAIRSQFQVMVNFATGAVFAEDDVDFTPSGFVDGSTTEIESLTRYFPPPDETQWLPPLHPWIDPYSRVAIATGLDGWTVYGEEGLIEGTEDAFEPLQSVWGIELQESFDTTCSETTFVGRAWEGASITSGPDPLLTESALNGRYGGDSHQALAGTASRIVELSCLPGGVPTIFQYRMKDGSGIRPFGPTGTIAMVKGASVVFFSPVRIHDGDLRQQFFATPSGGGQVEATIIEDEPKLLVPNPYAEFGTKVTIVPVEASANEAAADTATGLRLLDTASDESAVRAQTSGGCQPRSEVVFVDDLIGGALTAGFARRDSIRSVALEGDDRGLEIMYPDGSTQLVEWIYGDDPVENPGGYQVTMTSSSGTSCTTAVDIVKENGDILAGPSGATANEEPPETLPDDGAEAPGSETETSSTEPGSGSSIPWLLIALLLAALGGGAYAYTRTRTKPESPAPPSPTPPPADPKGPRTFSAEDRAALQEVYKGADEAGLKVVGISEITRLEDVKAGSKDNPVVIGKATKIKVGITADGSLVAPDDETATSSLSVEVIPSVEFDSDDDAHVVWSAYTREVDGATGTVKTSKSGPGSHEWEAKVDGRSDVEIGNDPSFKDQVVGGMADNPAEAVRIALERR